MRRLLTSFSSRLRLQVAEDFLAGFPRQEILFVAPTRAAADEVVRSVSLKAGWSFGVHRFTLPSLAVEIASPRLAAEGISILSGIAVDALAARAVESCRLQSLLHWFHPVATTPGFFRALASTINELRLNQVDTAILAESGVAGADLAILVREFEAALREARVVDLATVYNLAASESSRFNAMPVLLMDIVHANVAERRFIASITAQSPAVLASVHHKNDAAIQALGKAIGAPAEFIEEAALMSNGLDRLRRQVFAVATPPKGELDASVDFRSASDESREAVEVARSITAAARRGIPFDRIAILLRSPEAYQALIEDAMRRAGIPAFYTLGSRRPNPAGRAFLALLACASEGLSASRFGEYLSLGQVPAPNEPLEPNWVPIQGELFPPPVSAEASDQRTEPAEFNVRAPHAWEHLLVDAAVIGGRDRWERRLAGLDREMEKQKQEVSAEDEGRLFQLERRRNQLQDLRRFALPLIERLDRLPATTTWGGWLVALEQLASHGLRQAEGVLSALTELRPMSDIGAVTLDEVREVLTNRLTFLRTETTERRYGKVFVATIAEAAGMSFDTVFLPGLGEDIFPKRAFEDPLLLDEFRKKVSPDLAVQDTRVANERLLFHIAAGAAERRLFVSYPRMNLAQARARGPSFYALEVVRAVTGEVPDLQELQRTAAESSQSQAGWPSPRDPAAAIDDAEYDLALVSHLLRAPVDEARGRGRYLVTANASLARSLRNRAGRWRHRWTEGDGVVDAGAQAIAVLAAHRIEARPYSATALQHFAACPYRFLLHAVHRLRPREEITGIDKMDALTRGSLFHSIQFQLLSDLRQRDLLPITTANHRNILDIADSIIDNVAETYREELAPAIPRIWEGEVEDIRWDVRGWLREITQAGNIAAWKPQWFELSFGFASNRECDPASIPETVRLPGGLQLRGSIDMIEVLDGRIRITDHKTGKVPAVTPGLTGRGEVLQPVLYAQAAEELLKRPTESASLFYCTERGGYRSIEFPVNDESRAALQDVVRTIDESLAAGFLPAAPRDGACALCDYRIVCGPYEESRVRLKPKDRLIQLEGIRKGKTGNHPAL